MCVIATCVHCLSVYMSFYMSVSLYVHLSVHLFVSLSVPHLCPSMTRHLVCVGVYHLDVYPGVGNDFRYLLCSLLQSIMCCKTDTGRTLSDSLVPLHDTYTTLWTLEDISQSVDNGQYQQLDEFQWDVFAVLKYTRNTHRLESQVRNVYLLQVSERWILYTKCKWLMNDSEVVHEI